MHGRKAMHRCTPKGGASLCIASAGSQCIALQRVCIALCEPNCEPTLPPFGATRVNKKAGRAKQLDRVAWSRTSSVDFASGVAFV